MTVLKPEFFAYAIAFSVLLNLLAGNSSGRPWQRSSTR